MLEAPGFGSKVPRYGVHSRNRDYGLWHILATLLHGHLFGRLAKRRPGVSLSSQRQLQQDPATLWVAVKELDLSCHNPETSLITMYPYIMVV